MTEHKKVTENPAIEPAGRVSPAFSVDAVTCLGATLFNLRADIEALAIKRAKDKAPVPLSAMKIALLEHDLGWALPGKE